MGTMEKSIIKWPFKSMRFDSARVNRNRIEQSKRKCIITRLLTSVLS
jgi:hypothetical protein